MKITKKMIIFTVIGGLAGFLYAYFIGCHSGSCPITSNKFVATIFFATTGFILSLDGKKKTEKEVKENDTN